VNVYVASSWRNERQPEVVAALVRADHTVYDFRHPAPGNNGFHWSDIDPEWKGWSAERYRDLLRHPVAERGFGFDMDALHWCDACVLVMPCGRSAHLELGWCAGRGKPTVILLSDGEPELMYKIATHVCVSLDEVVRALSPELQGVAA